MSDDSQVFCFIPVRPEPTLKVVAPPVRKNRRGASLFNDSSSPDDLKLLFDFLGEEATKKLKAKADG